MVTYSLTFQNNSSNVATAAVYQKDPKLGIPDVFTLAWFSKTAAPNSSVVFTWEIDYNFVWSQTGELATGVLFTASQHPSANLSTTNQITLDYSDKDNYYEFKDQTKGPMSGSLYVQQTSSVPLKQAAVGIGMSGYGTFVVQAEPNTQVTFTPHPEYWIVAGSFSQGEVLDTQEIFGYSAQVQFSGNIYNMTAILSEENTWKVEPTTQTNAKLIAARKKNPKARWGAAS